jgi:hypothetical protein
LAECVRSVARGTGDRSRYVSDDVLVTVVPRPTLLRGQVVIGRIEREFVSATRIPPRDDRLEEYGGPILVGPDVAVQTMTPSEGPPTTGTIVSASRLVRRGPAGSSIVLWLLEEPAVGTAWGWPGFGRQPPEGANGYCAELTFGS